jgi:hypothetical protein
LLGKISISVTFVSFGSPKVFQEATIETPVFSMRSYALVLEAGECLAQYKAQP